jgi:hypothetical protein
MKIARLACVVALGAALALPAGASSTAESWIPLKAPAPAWYTPELHAQVMAAGPKGVTLPDSIEIPTSSLAFAGIRPGQMIILSGGAQCTTNFVFGSKGSYAIGTAGHCGKVGESVIMLFAPRVLANIGKVIKSTDGGVGNDFALISILPQFQNQVSPSMAHWGGPNGSYSGPGAPLIVKHSGHGLVVGTGGTPRVGVGVKFTATEWRFEGAIVFGDSGSGAIAGNGKAIGNITHTVVNGGALPPVYMAGTSIIRIKQIAGMSLALCPPIPWPLYGCP